MNPNKQREIEFQFEEGIQLLDNLEADEMGLISTLSVKEINKLSIGLIRDWWIASTQALVDIAGSETALKLLKPYHVNAGKAGAYVFQELTGISDPVDAAFTRGEPFAKMMDGVWGSGYMADDGSTIGILSGCATKGVCKEACISFCSYCICSVFEETATSREMQMTKSLSFGDEHCTWHTKIRTQSAEVTPTIEFALPPDHWRSIYHSDEMNDFLAHAWLGEIWVIGTRSLIDHLGSQKALDLLRPYMRHSGMSLALRSSERLNIKEDDLGNILDLVGLIQDLHRRKCKMIIKEDEAECTIEECPFSGAPPEICAQYESFFNGICEVLDPKYEFVYDKKMTMGERVCHWIIKKKSGSEKVTPQSITPSDDPMKIIKLRYARGEITKDEYIEMKRLLQGAER